MQSFSWGAAHFPSRYIDWIARFIIGENMYPAADFRKNPVFSEAYWRKPPNRNKGDDDGDHIYTAVGFAMSSWEWAEDDLASLYMKLIGFPHTNDHPARRAYGAIENGTARRKVVAAAAEAFF